jgi:hypothetical protein
MKGPNVICAVLVMTMVAAGCGGTSGSPDTSANVPSEKKRAPNEAPISKADVPRGAWPLTVSHGEVRCEGSAGAGAVIFRAPDGTDYGVNGTALGSGAPRIDPIWKKDPDIPGARVDIRPVLDKGLALCG